MSGIQRQIWDHDVVRCRDALIERAAAARARPPAPGTQRGVDFYAAPALREVVAHSLRRFKRVHGRVPALDGPERLTDKLYLAKFFMPIEVPTLADKLRVGAAIPAALAAAARPLPTAWSSPTAALPPDDALAPGVYWLKAAFGSEMNLKIDWPPSSAARAAAGHAAGLWLARPFGLRWGEWWYATAAREVLLCRHLGDRNACPYDFKFFVANDRATYLLVTRYPPDSKRRTRSYYDVDALRAGVWHKLPFQFEGSPNPDVPRPAGPAALLAAAEAIGRGRHAVRVDFMLAPDGAIHLAELTYCELNALATYSPATADAGFGRPWNVAQWWPGS
ncbi:MAG: hypothetical protein HY749_05370 [Gammaproteobacteria bacterium]|nr:hypothetical protein [Gammaproteobacteria bacterium]MBI5615863.1 hypothetical protein [Gammaproteobacteria bacterium]